MAKLYWRVKRDGKWTWKPAKIAGNINVPEIIVIPLEEEEWSEEFDQDEMSAEVEAENGYGEEE